MNSRNISSPDRPRKGAICVRVLAHRPAVKIQLSASATHIRNIQAFETAEAEILVKDLGEALGRLLSREYTGSYYPGYGRCCPPSVYLHGRVFVIELQSDPGRLDMQELDIVGIEVLCQRLDSLLKETVCLEVMES